MIHKKVEFRGEKYWHHNNLISPLDHYDESGELTADPFIDVSYAVIEGNDIYRFNEKIGEISELKDI